METIEKTLTDPHPEAAPGLDTRETQFDLVVAELGSIDGFSSYGWGTFPSGEYALEVDPGDEVKFCLGPGLNFLFPSYQVVTNPNPGSLFDGGFETSNCSPYEPTPMQLGTYEYLVVLVPAPALRDPTFPDMDWEGLKELWDKQEGGVPPLPPRIIVRNPNPFPKDEPNN